MGAPALIGLPPPVGASSTPAPPPLFEILLQICQAMQATGETMSAERTQAARFTQAVIGVGAAMDANLQKAIDALAAFTEPPAWVHYLIIGVEIFGAIILAVELALTYEVCPETAVALGILAGAIAGGLVALQETHVLGPDGMLDNYLKSVGYKEGWQRAIIMAATEIGIILLASLIAGGATAIIIEDTLAKQAISAGRAAVRVYTRPASEMLKLAFRGLSPSGMAGKMPLAMAALAFRKTELAKTIYNNDVFVGVLDSIASAYQMQSGLSSMGNVIGRAGFAGAKMGQLAGVLMQAVPMGVNSWYQIWNGKMEVEAAEPLGRAHALDGLKDMLMAGLQSAQAAPKAIASTYQTLAELAKAIANIPMEVRG